MAVMHSVTVGVSVVVVGLVVVMLITLAIVHKTSGGSKCSPRCCASVGENGLGFQVFRVHREHIKAKECDMTCVRATPNRTMKNQFHLRL